MHAAFDSEEEEELDVPLKRKEELMVISLGHVNCCLYFLYSLQIFSYFLH